MNTVCFPAGCTGKRARRSLRAVCLSVSLAFISVFQKISPVRAYDWTGGCISTEGSVENVATIQGIECLVRNMLNYGVGIVGFASFVMLLVGSLLILLSGGVPKNVDTGRKTITFALVGVVVSLTGWILLNFISVFTGVKGILEFNTQWWGGSKF